MKRKEKLLMVLLVVAMIAILLPILIFLVKAWNSMLQDAINWTPL